MKKIITIIVTLIIIIISIFICFKIKDNNDKVTKEANQKRYNEIKESVSKAYYNYLRAANLTNKDPKFCENSKDGHAYDEFLISNGYLKKEDLKDVDGKSYCKAWGKQWKTEDCGVDYKVYIHCKDYKDKGYDSWGEPLDN